MKRVLKLAPAWGLALLAIIGAVLYWGVLASDRYVSRSHIVLQSPEISPVGMNVSSLLKGTSGAGDLLLLKDHLESVLMLGVLQARLDLRAHYADPDIDWLSRMSARDLPAEKFHAYMQRRIRIVFDDYFNILRIDVQAFTPEMAQAINQALLEEGERHMNRMGQRLAEEQLSFIQQQVEELEQRLFAARNDLLSYQNEHGLVAPTQTVEAIFTTVARLEGELAAQRARIKAQASFQSASSPELRRLTAAAEALEQQIDIEKRKLARKAGNALNSISAEYETLELKAQFALELYSAALTTLETTRVEAARKLKQVSVLEYPTLAEFATEPRRIYNITVFILFALVLAAILQMIIAVVNDHRD